MSGIQTGIEALVKMLQATEGQEKRVTSDEASASLWFFFLHPN